MIGDESGQVALLLWQNVFEALPDPAAIAVGVRIRASGWVDEYRGELEIVPGVTHDILVLGGTGAP